MLLRKLDLSYVKEMNQQWLQTGNLSRQICSLMYIIFINNVRGPHCYGKPYIGLEVFISSLGTRSFVPISIDSRRKAFLENFVSSILIDLK